MAAGPGGIACRVAGAAEAVAGAGLLDLVAGLAGEAECVGVVGPGLRGMAGGEEDLAEQGQGLLKVAGSRDLGPDWHARHTDRSRKARNAHRQLEALGYDVIITLREDAA